MTTPVVNVEGNRGGTVVVTVAVTESDGTVSDLTGYTGQMQARATPDDTVVLMSGTVVIDTAAGLVQGTFSATDTAAALWNAAVFDMRIVGATTEYVAQGVVRLRPTVTR